jgi:hypothetical protein
MDLQVDPGIIELFAKQVEDIGHSRGCCEIEWRLMKRSFDPVYVLFRLSLPIKTPILPRIWFFDFERTLRTTQGSGLTGGSCHDPYARIHSPSSHLSLRRLASPLAPRNRPMATSARFLSIISQ